MRQTLEEVLDDLGRRLADLRRDRGWTQAEAAHACGMLEKDYQRIELGKRAISLRTVTVVAQAFDVTVRDLFDAPKMRAKRRPGAPGRRSPI